MKEFPPFRNSSLNLYPLVTPPLKTSLHIKVCHTLFPRASRITKPDRSPDSTNTSSQTTHKVASFIKHLLEGRLLALIHRLQFQTQWLLMKKTTLRRRGRYETIQSRQKITLVNKMSNYCIDRLQYSAKGVQYSLSFLPQPAEYAFTYVAQDENTGHNFGHEETRQGHRTQGSYYVSLPDGRVRKVSYYVEPGAQFRLRGQAELRGGRQPRPRERRET